MTIVTTKNEIVHIPVGCNLNGLALKRIIIEAGDQGHPDFLVWLMDVVLTRLVKE